MIQTTQRSNDHTLKSIQINGTEMFGHFFGNYLVLPEVSFGTTHIDILATATSSKATIFGNKQHMLSVGINILEVYAVSELGEPGQVYQIEINRLAASHDATLKSITIKDHKTDTNIEFLPVFSPDITKYTVSLSLADQISEIWVGVEATSSLVKSISGNGLGVNTLKAASSQTTEIFEIRVEAEDGAMKVYEIHVTRDLEPEDDVTIERLSLFGHGINYLGTHSEALKPFTMSQTNYTVYVPYHLNQVSLSITNFNGASIFGDGHHVLTGHSTTLSFHLISKSGQVQSDAYSITIVKEAPSSDSLLKSLVVNGLMVEDFSPTKYTYAMQVSYELIDHISVEAAANYQYAHVIGDLGNIQLSAGANTIHIRVIAEDGSMTTYTITVSRLSSDHQLRDLHVIGHQMNEAFSANRIRYEVTVPYTTEYVQLSALAHPNATIVNTGIKYLDVGVNVYEVYAIAENGLRGKTYEVHVTRELVSTDSLLKSLVVRDAVTYDVIPFNPVFRATTTDYIITLEQNSTIDSLYIEGIANDAFASVGGNGYKVLKAKVDGDYHNVFEITVRAQDHSTTTYTISVFKGVDLSHSTTIHGLSLVGSDGINYLGTENARSEFIPHKYAYEIIVPYHVSAMTLDVKTVTATAYGTGTKVFDTNVLQFTTYLISQSGVNYTVDYTIQITREEANHDNLLKTLKLNGVEIDNFNPEVTYYEITVPHQSLENIMLNAESQNIGSQVTGDLGVHYLSEGKNLYSINVVAQNGDIKTYTIAINYRNANAFLDDLMIMNQETEQFINFAFDPQITEYNVYIGKQVNDVLVTARAQDQYHAAIIGLGRYVINDQGTKLVVNVIAADHQTMLTYTINLVREETLSNNAKLKSLSVLGQDLNFNPNQNSYQFTVNNGTKALSVLAETDCQDARVNILGADDISYGRNIVMVEVVAEDGTIVYYQLLVNKESEPDHFLTMMLIISLFVWIITVLVFLIRASRDKKHYQRAMIK